MKRNHSHKKEYIENGLNETKKWNLHIQKNQMQKNMSSKRAKQQKNYYNEEATQPAK